MIQIELKRHFKTRGASIGVMDLYFRPIFILEPLDALIPPGVYCAIPDTRGSHQHWTLAGPGAARVVGPGAGQTWEDVEIHVGNFMSETNGCLLAGLSAGFDKDGAPRLYDSVAALKAMHDELDSHAAFWLAIRDDSYTRPEGK